MNVAIDPIKVFVHESFLYDGDETKTEYVNAEVIGISSYLDQTLTFHVLIDKQYLYSDLPVSAFSTNKRKPRDLKDLCYSNCKSLPIDVFKLNTDEVMIYFKDHRQYESGRYILSVDFYEGNDLMHLIHLNTGEFCLMPNHKINFNNEKSLTDYKKNRTIFKV
jgi:hypothetical protein